VSARVCRRTAWASGLVVVLVLAVVALVAVPSNPSVAVAAGTSPAVAAVSVGTGTFGSGPSVPGDPGSHTFLPADSATRSEARFSSLLPTLPAWGAAREGPGPLSGDPANPQLANYSYTTSVAAVGPSNLSAVAGAEDLSMLESGSGFFWTHGLSAAFRTTNGGDSWESSWLGQNSSWSSPSSWGYGDLTFGEPSVAGGANGTVLYAAIYTQPCNLIDVACNSTVNFTGPAGIAVARSTDSGVTWSPPAAVNNESWFKEFSLRCGSTEYAGPLPANVSDKPSVAYSAAAGEGLVSWDELSYTIATFCSSGVGEYEITDLTLSVQVSVSHNNGITWSAPKTVGRINTGDPASQIGPAPSYPLSVVYDDDYNGSATFHDIAYADSTDGGTKWNAPVDIGPDTLTYLVGGAPPDAFTVPTLPSYAVDNWSSSPDVGNEYVVVGSNLTSSVPGTPSVVFVRSAAGSGVWSSAVVLDRGDAALQYFEPTVTVGPTGRVWVVFYEMLPATGQYQLFGQYSDDGGSVWSSPFAIADTPGAPGATTLSIGSWVGAAATSAGLYSAWTDCRAATCTTDGVTAVDAALTEPVAISASVPDIPVTVTTSGTTTTGTVPLETGWDDLAGVDITVPGWTSLSNSTYWVGVFSNYTGLTSANSASTFFDFSGGSSLEANYVASPAGWVAGTVSPSAADPTVTIDGAAAVLGPYNATALSFNESVEGGLAYTVVASAAGYTSVTDHVTTVAGRSAPGPIVLARSPGWIRGTLVSPFPATLTVNGTPVGNVNPATGAFNVSVNWGAYWVNASGTGLTHSSVYVDVAPGRSSVVNLTLVGAWVDGVVSPGNATVRIDGHVAAVASGAFNVSVPAGTHTVTAAIPGYSEFSATVDPAAGRVAFVVVSITDQGVIRGTVDPVSASVLINGVVVPVVSGTFDAPLPANAVYNVTVAAPGYDDGYANVAVTPANTSFQNFTLTAAPGGCTGSCGGHGGGSPTGGASALPYSWLDVGIAAAVILGVAAVVAGLLLRPARAGSSSTEPSPPTDGPGAGASPPPNDQGIYGDPDSEPPGSDPPRY
jgi:hypothetical protein